jgi:hypothetical protein
MMATRWSFLPLAVSLGCAPAGTPPPPDPETREIEAATATPDRDRRGPLGIPERELPKAGQCRVWHQSRPSAEQPAPQPCGEAESAALPGDRILYRPADDERVVHVRVLDPSERGKVIRVDLYDAEKETYIGTQPQE